MIVYSFQVVESMINDFSPHSSWWRLLEASRAPLSWTLWLNALRWDWHTGISKSFLVYFNEKLGLGSTRMEGRDETVVRSLTGLEVQRGWCTVKEEMAQAWETRLGTAFGTPGHQVTSIVTTLSCFVTFFFPSLLEVGASHWDAVLDSSDTQLCLHHLRQAILSQAVVLQNCLLVCEGFQG